MGAVPNPIPYSVKWVVDIAVGDYFLSLCVHKSRSKHVFDFEQLPSYIRLSLRREGMVAETKWNKIIYEHII
jgi:hypothetical protein